MEHCKARAQLRARCIVALAPVDASPYGGVRKWQFATRLTLGRVQARILSGEELTLSDNDLRETQSLCETARAACRIARCGRDFLAEIVAEMTVCAGDASRQYAKQPICCLGARAALKLHPVFAGIGRPQNEEA